MSLTIRTVQSGHGTLSLNGVAMNRLAWSCYDIRVLFEATSELRGRDQLIPATAGVRANRRRRTVTVKELPMWVTGHYDLNGLSQTDPAMAMITNFEYLDANIGIASTGTGGTVTASWTRPDATVRTAAVHVLGLRPVGESVDFVQQATLMISIPVGKLS